ncbi:MAG: phosphoribosylanthranilate isomerase [Oscillospiraceae bacterium]|jgi:phosphoribosylanthranilate isomerase|nr:phosphoribosylanthranilate isomerase [Oscillospiraceae bacterium]
MQTKIKICGLRREADIRACNEAAPDYVGFVFAASKRQVTPEAAAQLRAGLAPGIATVGVFVDAPVATIAALHRQGVIDIAQLHGSEDAAYAAALRAQCGIPILRALRIATPADLARIADYQADWLLLDSGAGSGKPFDWSLLNPVPTQQKIFLAGGVGLHNIEQALALHPYAVDVSSGAETDGYKDPAKIKALVARVRKGGDAP